jgi:hypothetical protein
MAGEPVAGQDTNGLERHNHLAPVYVLHLQRGVPISILEQRSWFMATIYLSTATAVIAVVAIYFLWARKLVPEGDQVRASVTPHSFDL